MSEESFVLPFSNQWIYTTFRLQLILGSPQIQILNLRKRTYSFPEQFQNHLKIETAVDLTDMDLPSITSIKQSLKKDLFLKAGRINLNLQNAQHKKFRILFLKTAFTQALPCLKEASLSAEDFLVHEPQFDAVYMSPRLQELSVFSHEYLVKDPKQYQWQYDVQFTLAQTREWKADSVFCANCKIVNAKWFCIEDEEPYCQKCFGDLHRSDRKSKHIRQVTSPYNCPRGCQKGLHHNEPLTHYCFMCKQLKCVHCLADGQHRGNKETHQTMLSRQFAVMFNDTLRQKIDEGKKRLVTAIRDIQNKIQLISSHYEMRVKEYMKAFQERVSSVRQWVSVQLNVAAGLHSELKRKFDQSLWLQTMSTELEDKYDAELGMQVKEGINIYLNECFSSNYFMKLEKKVQDLKMFS